jgi:hypothetical protein
MDVVRGSFRGHRFRRFLGDQELVSRKLPPLIGFVAIEAEAFGQWPAQRLQPGQRFRAAVVALDLEAARSRDGDLDLVAFPKPERFNNRSREPPGKAVAPFRDAH